MPEFLKGNYKVDIDIEDKADALDSTDEFEKKALSRLGGSICFVSKKKLLWQGETSKNGDDKAKTDGAGTKNSPGA